MAFERLRPSPIPPVTFDQFSLYWFSVTASERQGDLPIDIYSWELASKFNQDSDEFPPFPHPYEHQQTIESPSPHLDRLSFRLIAEYVENAPVSARNVLLAFSIELRNRYRFLDHGAELMILKRQHGFQLLEHRLTSEKMTWDSMIKDSLPIDIDYGYASLNRLAQRFDFPNWDELNAALMLADAGIAPMPHDLTRDEIQQEREWVQRRVDISTSFPVTDEQSFKSHLDTYQAAIHFVADFLSTFTVEPIIPEPIKLSVPLE